MTDVFSNLDTWFHISEPLESVMEDLFVKICVARGVGKPVSEYRFAPPRRWRFDYAWPDERIALEVEGGVWVRGRHTRGSGFVKDIEKYNEAAVRGWCVLRTVPDELNGAVLLVERAMKERAA